MLTELYRLTESLRAAGIRVPPRHPRVGEPGKSAGTAMRVRLNANGDVTGLERITDDEWPGLWIISDHNHNFFPVCRLGFSMSEDAWSKRDVNLLGRLNRKALELKAACGGHSDVSRVASLADRFLMAAANPEQLHTSLKRYGAKIVSDGGKYQFAFDLDQGTIYRAAVKEGVARVLPHHDGGRHPAKACAYTGEGTSLQVGPFPAVRLPVLNKAFPLVSMFSEASCNYRYGLTDSSVVPVATSVALEMQNALAFIVDDEREGRTWRGVWNGHFEKSGGRPRERRDLLIAYVESGVDLPAPIADLFGADPDSKAKQFEVDASAVCDALDGVARKAPASRLNLFVLRRVSEGQAQVQLSVQPTVGAVIEAARFWQEGGKNIPEVAVPAVSKQGSPSFYQPRIPHPDRLVSLTSREWMESGKRWSPSRGTSLRHVLTMMLKDAGWDRAATDLLRLTISRTWPLMVGLFGSLLRLRPEKSANHGYSPEACRNALLTTSALGILLYALGHRKEEYMHAAPFLVGRLLALADLLHREHARHEREAEPPSQMIGNALMTVAQDNPTAAIARLSGRLPFYKAWAERSNDGLAKWAAARIQGIATDLESVGLPLTMHDADRAQLILGYVARLSDSNAGEQIEEAPTGGTDD
jgi:hypothetical protein